METINTIDSLNKMFSYSKGYPLYESLVYVKYLKDVSDQTDLLFTASSDLPLYYGNVFVYASTEAFYGTHYDSDGWINTKQVSVKSTL